MNKKRKRIKLSEQTQQELKLAVTAYLGSLIPRPLGELNAALMAPGVLVAMELFKHHYLVQPEMTPSEAYYLKSGYVILYKIDPVSGDLRIYYIWEPNTIIVMFKEFREKLPVGEDYIQLISDCVLVRITSFSMDEIYEEHTVAHDLTQKILTLKTDRSNLQLEILLNKDKLQRYCMMKRFFPSLFVNGKCILTNEQVCGFINVSESILLDGKKICTDE